MIGEENASKIDMNAAAGPTFTTGNMEQESLTSEPRPQMNIFLLQLPVPLLCGGHESFLGVVGQLHVVDALFVLVHAVLGPLSDGTLGFPVVGALPLQLGGREAADATRARSRGSSSAGAGGYVWIGSAGLWGVFRFDELLSS